MSSCQSALLSLLSFHKNVSTNKMFVGFLTTVKFQISSGCNGRTRNSHNDLLDEELLE